MEKSKKTTRKRRYTIKDLIASVDKVEKKLSENIELICSKFKDFEERIVFEYKRNEESFENLIKLSQTVEESLGNVYLAIKQNEYLQAWYPAQSGFPDMKVVGIHPAKKSIQQSKRSKEENDLDQA